MDSSALCFVSNYSFGFRCLSVWLTDNLAKQWGDDWDDVPYEHNAGEPYEARKDGDPKPVQFIVVGDYRTPDRNHSNSPYSVQSINKKAHPWLVGDARDSHQSLYAGATLEELKAFVSATGGLLLKAVDGRLEVVDV